MKSIRPYMINIEVRRHSKWEIEFGYHWIRKYYRVLVIISRLCGMDLSRYWRRWEIAPTDSIYPHTCAFTQ